ncbi:MAG: BON domain-containing protein [Comamonadaceae bacterium]|nr:MAG: BON domain-containing protein [Comamonadaceae bacterium]
MTHTHPTPRTAHRLLGLAAAVAMACGLAACNKTDDQTVGQRLDSAVAKTEQVAADAQRKMEVAANDAGAATRDAAAKAAAVMDDAGITAKVSAGLAKEPDLSGVKIDVDTRNGIVTLNGPVKTSEARSRAAQIAQSVDGVNSVVNQLTISNS